MNKERLNLPLEQEHRIFNILQSQGFSQSEIDIILNGEYSSFQSENDLTNLFSSDGKYQDVLRGLADGYSIDELPQVGIKQSEIQDFLGMLDKCNLSVENAKAINQYSNGSNMILSVKRGITSREEIQSGINKEMFEKLQLRGMPEEQISEVQKFIETLNLDRPVHENFNSVNEYISQMNIPRNCYSPICTAVSGMDKLKHIDITIESLDEGLSKSKLPESIKLYRAIKTNGQRQPEDYLGKSMSNEGYTSTSPLYESSFAKYDDYDTVMEIYAPKGTQGTYMTELSDYDNVEQEVLLNSNDIYVIDAQKGVIDQNGRTKTVVKGLLLSKQRECYKGIDKQKTSISSEKRINQQQDESIIDSHNVQNNLPATQSRFSRFFSQVRSRFSRKSKVNDNIKSPDYKTSQSKPKIQEKKSWELEPEEKSRIQKETAEIAKRHREQQEKQMPQQEVGQDQENIQQTQPVVQEGQQINQEQQVPVQPQQPMVDMGGMEL